MSIFREPNARSFDLHRQFTTKDFNEVSAVANQSLSEFDNFRCDGSCHSVCFYRIQNGILIGSGLMLFHFATLTSVGSGIAFAAYVTGCNYYYNRMLVDVPL